MKKVPKSNRHNIGKPKWSLLHYESLEPLVRVMEYGVNKYSRDNWKIGMNKSEILDSLSRHLMALMDGQEIDLETSISHAGHIMANAMFYIYHSNKIKQKDKK